MANRWDRILARFNESRLGRLLAAVGALQLLGAAIGVIGGVFLTVASPLLQAPVYLQVLAIGAAAIAGVALTSLVGQRMGWLTRPALPPAMGPTATSVIRDATARRLERVEDTNKSLTLENRRLKSELSRYRNDLQAKTEQYDKARAREQAIQAKLADAQRAAEAAMAAQSARLAGQVRSPEAENSSGAVIVAAQDHRSAQEKQAEAEKKALISDGEDIAQSLRGVDDPPDDEPRTGTAGALVRRARNWLAREEQYWPRWHPPTPPSGLRSLGSVGLMNSILGGGLNPEGEYFSKHVAPAPVWRQTLVLTIEYRIERLKKG